MGIQRQPSLYSQLKMFGDDSRREDGEELQLASVKAARVLGPGDKFKIHTKSYAGRTLVVRTSDETGITAWDEAEMQYQDRKRTLFCIGAIPLNGFIADGKFEDLTAKVAAFNQRRVREANAFAG